VVLKMTEEYTGKYYHTYFSNIFHFCKTLKLHTEKKICAHGTAWLGKDWPNELKNPKALKLKLGESCRLQHGGHTSCTT
jgi:hypothetical protein